MSERPAPPELRGLADELGVATTYETVDGVEHAAPVETIVAAARAMGVAIDSVEDAPAAYRDLMQARATRRLEPVIVGRPGTPVTLDPGTAGSLHVDVENGEQQVHRVTDGPVRIGALPVGIHQLRFEPLDRSRPETATVIVAPASAYRPQPEDSRRWGVFAPAYALHDGSTGPVGGLRELSRLADITLDRGGRIVGTLPLLATFLGAGDEPYDPSPYSPVSRRFWNELYLDPRALPELDPDDLQSVLAEPASGALVDPRAGAARLRPALEAAATRVDAQDSARRRSLRAYLAADPQVGEYARFRARLEGTGDAGVRYHQYAQWATNEAVGAFADRLATRGGALYLDLPVGTNRSGFDVASDPTSFVSGMSVGAPPDSFFADGQNWGFPPLDPHGLRATAFASLRATLEHHLRFSRVLRIDHVMGLHRLFWIPEGESATAGTYVSYPSDEIYALLAVLSHRYGSMIVGENLGTVPASVNEALQRNGIDRMRVFELDVYADDDDPLVRPEAETLSSLNTHDTPTFAAFWRGTDIDARVEVGHTDEAGAAEERAQRAALRSSIVDALVDRRLLAPRGPDDDPADESTERSVFDAVLGFTAASDADIVLITLEDLWGETRAQNIPGTGAEVPNWRRRTARSLDDVAADAGILARLEAIDRSRRDPPAPAPPTRSGPSISSVGTESR
ncbi:MAG: 4-alpha-glucanotransferase [Actinomycetia bacterium]|nr:4-alpha-glucanotransferase [Actinomycetes bacterium]